MQFLPDDSHTTRADEAALPLPATVPVPDAVVPAADAPTKPAPQPLVVWVMDRAFGLVALVALTYAVARGSISPEAYFALVSALGASHYGVRTMTGRAGVPGGLGVVGLLLLTGLAVHLPMAAHAWRAVAAVPVVGTIARRAVASIAAGAVAVACFAGCAAAPSPMEVLHTTRQVTCGACNMLVKAEEWTASVTSAPDAGAVDAAPDPKPDAGAEPGDAAPVAVFDAPAVRDLDAPAVTD